MTNTSPRELSVESSPQQLQGDLQSCPLLDVSFVDEMIQASPDAKDVWRSALNVGQQRIHERFLAGVPIACVLADRSAVMDRVLTRLWEREGSVFDGLSLVAVGGYGRTELHPHSDIDIAIILPEDGDSKLDEVLSRWVTALWDLQLDIGYSVRTLSDCIKEAAADITVITNLMESRLITGDTGLLERVRQITATSEMWSSSEFYAAKLEEQNQRRERFRTNAYRLEPNIKESVGGLRDFQTIAWVCHRQFGTSELHPLVQNHLLEPDELDSLKQGLELLWRIRYLLHYLAGRREDRLLFDYQRDIAHAFGYTVDENNQCIETLMQRFYRTVMTLQRLNEILLQGIGGIISGITASSEVTPLSKRFQLRNGFLEVTHDDVFMHYPPALLELFLIFGDTPDATNVRSNTVRLIRANLRLINERFRSDPVVRSLFLKIFINQNRLTTKVRMMNRYGVMAAYLPAFDAIVGRMQYDLFHIYTVDEHTMLVIRNLRRMTLPQHKDELPHCSEIAATINKPELLFLIALFHDIAKGRGGDHSELGSHDMQKFAISHGMDKKDTELTSWVVRHHLIMSMTAQRKDIDDPRVQLDFAREVGSLEKLNFLYLLTVADIRATNPELWNSFKQSLLRSLYQHTLIILERGLENALQREDVIARRQAKTLNLLPDELDTDPRLHKLWASLGEDYFQQYQATEIARHTEILLANHELAGPLVYLRHSPSRGSTEILIYTPDDNALFALITTVLEKLQLNVLSASINTTADGYALDTFNVLDSDGSLIKDSYRIDNIQSVLQRELQDAKDLPSLGEQRASRRLSHFSVDTEVHFENLENELVSVRIIAADRPGILSSIGRILQSAEVAVHAARITTLGERIDDVFFVRNRDGSPYHDSQARESLTQQLIEHL